MTEHVKLNNRAKFASNAEEIEYYSKLHIVKEELNNQKTIEANTLATMIESPAIIKTAFKILREKDFFHPDSYEMYKCLIDMWKNNIPIDRASVMTYAQGKYKIPSDLYRNVTAVVLNTVTQKQIYFQKESAIRLRTKAGFLKAFDAAFSLDAVSDVFEQNSELIELLKDVVKINEVQIDNLHDAGLKAAAQEEANIKSGKFSGVSTGFTSLDYRTGGFMNTDLILIAARPGMGKTAYVISTIKKKLSKKEPFLFFSLEMSTLKLLKRLFSQIEQIDLNRITANKLTPEEQIRFFEFCANLPNNCYIIDSVFDINEIESISKKYVEEYGVLEIYLDYLHLCQGVSGDNANERVGKISSRLKRIAKELDVPIIALSQLSREPKPNFKTGKYSVEDLTPMLSDLRDSGSLEQDASVVIFLLRLEYYRNKLEKYDEEETGRINIICAKFRDGTPFNQKMLWIPSYAQVQDNPETIMEIEKKQLIEEENGKIGGNKLQDEYVEPNF